MFMIAGAVTRQTREPLREHESHTIYRQQPREQRVAGISRRL